MKVLFQGFKVHVVSYGFNIGRGQGLFNDSYEKAATSIMQHQPIQCSTTVPFAPEKDLNPPPPGSGMALLLTE